MMMAVEAFYRENRNLYARGMNDFGARLVGSMKFDEMYRDEGRRIVCSDYRKRRGQDETNR
jgi:hypothetical protein